MLVCLDNWYFKPLCVRTIGDTIDCQNTYEKVRVFSIFLLFSPYIDTFFASLLLRACIIDL